MNKKSLKSTLIVAMIAVAGYGGFYTYESHKQSVSELALADVEANADVWDSIVEFFNKVYSWVVLEDYYEEVEAGSLVTVEVSAESESGAKVGFIDKAFQATVNASLITTGKYSVSYYTKVISAWHKFDVNKREDGEGKYSVEQEPIELHRFQQGGMTDCSRDYEVEKRRGCK